MAEIDPIRDMAKLVAPPTPYSGMRFSQGTILSWDANTFENEIDWRGITLTNVPILGSTDALTYQPGDIVGLQGWQPTGGLGTWWISGRIITPGAGAAAQQIQFLQSALAEQIATEIISRTVHYDFVSTRESTTSTTFTDLATVGPQVDEVQVANGVMVVIVSAQIELLAAGGGGSQGHMSYEVAGPTPRSPNITDSASFLFSTSSADSFDIRPHCAMITVETELDSGEYVVTAKYNSVAAGATFGRRGMLVIGF